MIPLGWYDIVRGMIAQHVGRMVRFARVSVNTASGDGDSVHGHQPGDEEEEYQYQIRRLWPFGIRSRPPAGVDAVVVHAFGGATNGIMVGAESPEYGPGDLAEGETAIYCKASGTVIRLDKDGAITVETKANQAINIAAGTGAAVNISAGTGASVVVNGGANNVARAAVDTAGPYPITGGALFFKA